MPRERPKAKCPVMKDVFTGITNRWLYAMATWRDRPCEPNRKPRVASTWGRYKCAKFGMEVCDFKITFGIFPDFSDTRTICLKITICANSNAEDCFLLYGSVPKSGTVFEKVLRDASIRKKALTSNGFFTKKIAPRLKIKLGKENFGKINQFTF